MRIIHLLWLVLALMAPAAAEYKDPELEAFIQESVLTELRASPLPAPRIRTVLAQDEAGRPLYFIPGCPICGAVQKGFEAFLAEAPESGDAGADLFTAEDALVRTRTVSVYVQGILTRRMAAMDWTPAQRSEWESRMKRAADAGLQALKQLQSEGVETYARMWSCQMCDAGVRASEGKDPPRP